GGQQAKIQTVWLNLISAPATPTIQLNYTIQQLDELLAILGH
ncbi:HAD family hydrolase, partial [Enterococcus faecalis]